MEDVNVYKMEKESLNKTLLKEVPTKAMTRTIVNLEGILNRLESE